MNKRFFVRILLSGLFLFFGCALTSCQIITGEQPEVVPKEDFEISSYFCDGMVLEQREMVIIKGMSEAGVTIKASLYRNDFVNKTITNIANDKGEFILSFEAPKASKDIYRLDITDGVHKKSFNNIHFGDVFLVCGDGYVSKTTEQDDTFKNTNKGYISFYQNNEWITDSTDDNKISDFVYGFALEMSDNENIPIGVVVAVAPSVHIDSWLSPKLIDDNKRVNDFLSSEHRLLELSGGYYEDYDTMSSFYKQTLEIVLDFSFKAVIWSQGDGNFENKNFKSVDEIKKYVADYQYVLLKLIEQFYVMFKNISIFILQSPSSLDEYVPHLRNVQAVASYYYSYVNLITTYDLNEINTIRTEQDDYENELDSSEIKELGEINVEKVLNRLVNAIHATLYKKISGYLPPSYINAIYDNDYIHLYFSNASKLELIGEKPIVLKDENGNSIETEITIEGNWVIITIPKDVTNEETGEIEKAPIIAEIAYGQVPNLTTNIIVNEQGIAMIPFVINVTDYH